MQKAINTLTARIERLNEEFKKAEKIIDEPELLSDYEFALNDMANIETEIIELKFAINSLKDLNPKKNKVVLDNQGSTDSKLILGDVSHCFFYDNELNHIRQWFNTTIDQNQDKDIEKTEWKLALKIHKHLNIRPENRIVKNCF